MVIKGLNHQVNPLDLVQIKAKHEIWEVQHIIYIYVIYIYEHIRQRSQVTSAGHCSVDKLILSDFHSSRREFIVLSNFVRVVKF